MKLIDKIKDYINDKKSEWLKTRFRDLSDIKNAEFNKRDVLTGGTTINRFALFTGDYFTELFDELRNNPNCSYVTYLNEVIKEGYNPENVSALIKIPNYNPHALREILASKVCNYFSIPVAYYKRTKGYEVLTVDFLQKNETFETFGDNHFNSLRQDDNFDSFNRKKLRELFSVMNKTIQEFYESISSNPSKEIIEEQSNQMKEDFLKSYLVRVVFLGDTDLHDDNVGIIKNSVDGYIKLAPTYDLARTLGFEMGTGSRRKINGFIDLYKSDYPKILDGFIVQLKDLFEVDEKTNKSPIDLIGESMRLKGDCWVDVQKKIVNSANLILNAYENESLPEVK